MSHFTVLVIGDDVEGQLQPYHEYECTGIKDEFVIFEPCEYTLESLEEQFKKSPAYDNFDLFMNEYHGCYKNEKGVYGRMTNPNSKWDWWVVGGRWSNHLLLKDGSRVNSALKKDVDFDGMRKKAGEDAKITYNNVISLIGDYVNDFVSWDVVREEMFKGDIDSARNYYNAQPAIKALRKNRDYMVYSIEDFLCDEVEYIKNAEDSAVPTFAVVKAGNWYERGDMSWWACVSNEKDMHDWHEEFNKLVDELPGDTLLTIVDCHI